MVLLLIFWGKTKFLNLSRWQFDAQSYVDFVDILDDYECKLFVFSFIFIISMNFHETFQELPWMGGGGVVIVILISRQKIKFPFFKTDSLADTLFFVKKIFLTLKEVVFYFPYIYCNLGPKLHSLLLDLE